MAKVTPKIDKGMTSAEVIKMMLPPFKRVEVREKQNGTWAVFYPDPGFVPCAPVCDLKKHNRAHKCDYEQGWVETHYKPTSQKDALKWAEYLADGREVKIISYVPLAERRRQKLELDT